MILFKWFKLGGKDARAAPQSSAAQSLATTALPTYPNRKRVLIVDHDPVFLRATSMKLRAAGFQVRTAQDGSEAIAALREKPADAVLMDINLPADVYNGGMGMGSWDGFQLMDWLRGWPTTRGTRFIMVSNSDSPEYRSRAAKLGAVAYLRKPLHDKLLLAALKPPNGTPVNAPPRHLSLTPAQSRTPNGSNAPVENPDAPRSACILAIHL